MVLTGIAGVAMGKKLEIHQKAEAKAILNVY